MFGFVSGGEGARIVLQPARPEQGFGSSAGYISPSATRFEAGVAQLGTQVYWYIPAVLLDGNSAPIVVFLHGFGAVQPELYQGHIDHLTKQGYIVVFPQFQKTGVASLRDTDQNEMLSRAVASTEVALGRIGSQGERRHLFLYGHSLGGLLAATWMSEGGARPAGIVAANPSLGGGVPKWVQTLFPITNIDLDRAASTWCPVLILTGDADTVAPPSEAIALFGALKNARFRAVAMAQSDTHGWPPLRADHVGPLSSFGIEDALDYRFYEASLDAVLVNAVPINFKMGFWSDGQPVLQPKVLRIAGRY